VKYVFNETIQKFVPKERQSNAAPYVQPDIEEYGGRVRFREHLKRTNTVELGHSDMVSAHEKWQGRRSAFQDRIRAADNRTVRPVEANVTTAPDYQMTRLNAEMANRLDGRPMPERKELLKLTLETARRMNRR
jgi:hypothetical protein